jgi:hypothetical protein
MGATYYSLQLRTSERDPVVLALKDVATHYKAENLRFYVAEPRDGGLAVFPSFAEGPCLPHYEPRSLPSASSVQSSSSSI